jgi:cytoskeletal protein RodZ
MSLEGLGKRFQEARVARGLSLEDAARLTKIRPSRLEEIEAEDFSNFPSLAYAKGFLMIYGKFLNVDVSLHLEAFESSPHMTVDGYSYLQDNPAPKQRTIVRPKTTNKTSLLPLIIGLVVLIGGFSIIKFVRDIQRIAPPRRTVGIEASPSLTPTPGRIVAPRALPAETTPARMVAAPSAIAIPTAEPTLTPPVVAVEPAPTEPEVRRAEPVHPEDLKKLGLATAGAFPGAINRLEIRPRKKTYLKVVVDNDSSKPPFERWVSSGDGVLRFKGQHIAVKVLDRDAVEMKKNGQPLADDDADITVE